MLSNILKRNSNILNFQKNEKKLAITFFGVSFYLVTRLGNPFMYNPAFQSFSKEITQQMDKLVISCPSSQLLISSILFKKSDEFRIKNNLVGQSVKIRLNCEFQIWSGVLSELSVQESLFDIAT